MKTLPLDWLYPVDGKGVVVLSCTSGVLVEGNEVVGPPEILDGLDRLIEDLCGDRMDRHIGRAIEGEK